MIQSDFIMRFNLSSRRLAQIKNILFLLIIVCLPIVFFSSCSTLKNSYYFKSLPRDTSLNNLVNKPVESTIRKNDQLSILISSLNPVEDAVYNAPAMSLSNGGGTGSNGGYQVDAEGKITLHRLGAVAVEGLTRRQLKEQIETQLRPYLKDPVVTVRYLNRRVTVLGQVQKPQVVVMPEERLSLLEVLGSSGDVSELARRDNVLVIRETETGKQFKRVNLEDHTFFTTEWFYLQPDDVVYIEPSEEKIKQARRVQNQQSISLLLSGVSVAVIILDRVLR